MRAVSYATSESYENGVEVKRSEFERAERVDGALRSTDAAFFEAEPVALLPAA